MKRLGKLMLLAGGLLALWLVFNSGSVLAEEAQAPPTAESVNQAVDTLRTETDWLWTCIAAFLVFFMQAGFAMVEAGFTRAKNTVNILMKNLMDFSVGSIAFWAVGFGLMFGATVGGFFGSNYFFVSGNEEGAFNAHTAAFWLFQVVFAATAATIVSGAMAERTKFIGYLIYSVFISALIYPVFGSWAWGSLWKGEGWLESIGVTLGLMNEGGAFLDFAGSTVVHSVGGWAALAGAIVLGARIGKYDREGKPRAIPGHSIPLATLGVFILWLGWFGFNPGSTTAVGEGSFARIAVTTNLAAAAGAIAAMAISWLVSSVKKPDLAITLNGALAGLVAITCPCDVVTNAGAILIGAVAGVLVYFSVLFFDRIGVDDPVGAVSVHAVCGAWGTLSAGLFAAQGVLDGTFEGSAGLFYGGGFAQLIVQVIGILACFIWTFATAFTLFSILKACNLLRVPAEDELVGLDVSEMGLIAYSGFQIHDPTEDRYAAQEPRPAALPPDGMKRFVVVVEGASSGDLMHKWSELCQPSASMPTAFGAVYPFMTTVEGNRFCFRGGNPHTIRDSLESLFKERLGSNISAHVEG
jgi:Amt family ammonium transporter